MKLHFGLKIFLAILILAGVSYLIYRDDRPSVEKQKPVPLEVVSSGKSNVFDVTHVLSLTWSFRQKKIYCLLSKCDPWSFKRRLAILSVLENPIDVSISQPLGEVSVGLTDESRVALQGVYDDKSFVWVTGPFKGKGFLFENNLNVKNIFMEGVEGLADHKIPICKPESLTQVTLESSSLHRENGKWFVFSKEGKELGPAGHETVTEWLNQVCNLQITYFVPDEKQLKFENSVLTIKQKSDITFSKQGSIYFVSGIENKLTHIPFTSDSVDHLVQVDFKNFIDPNFSYSKTMLDSTKTQQERLGAIREIKKLKSVAALPALRKIIFEKTEIDLYRYEAVDALVEIGTYAAYKIIAERLAEVPQSGFQLRLARALAPPLGESFISDEHTPEEPRRLEVQNLLKEYKKHPPGL